MTSLNRQAGKQKKQTHTKQTNKQTQPNNKNRKQNIVRLSVLDIKV